MNTMSFEELLYEILFLCGVCGLIIGVVISCFEIDLRINRGRKKRNE